MRSISSAVPSPIADSFDENYQNLLDICAKYFNVSVCNEKLLKDELFERLFEIVPIAESKFDVKVKESYAVCNFHSNTSSFSNFSLHT